MREPPTRLSHRLGEAHLPIQEDRFLIVTYDEHADEELVWSAAIVVDDEGCAFLDSNRPLPVWQLLNPRSNWSQAEVGYWLAKNGVHVSASMLKADMVKIAGALTGELEIKAEIRGMLGETKQELIAAWLEDRAIERAHEELDDD